MVLKKNSTPLTLNQIFEDFANQLTKKEIITKYNLAEHLFYRYKKYYKSMITSTNKRIAQEKLIKLNTPPVCFNSKQESYYTEEEMLKYSFIGKGEMKKLMK